MKAVLCRRQPGAAAAALEDVELPPPTPGPRDLVVRIEAAALNPLDRKRRAARPDPDPQGEIPGWDAAGTVESVGEAVMDFRPGDGVYYAGSILRPGCLSELHLVDERITALRPVGLCPAKACALPLAALTASEALWDHLQLRPESGPALLLIAGGAGSVASMAVQLARTLPSLTVVATAADPRSRDWLLSIGAHHVLSYERPLAEQFGASGIPQPRAILSMFTSSSAWRHYAEIVEPFGRICIVDHPHELDFGLVRSKSVAVHWQAMFTRSSFRTGDMARQSEYLREVASLVERGKVRPQPVTVTGTIAASPVEAAHGARFAAPGKQVFEGFRP